MLGKVGDQQSDEDDAADVRGIIQRRGCGRVSFAYMETASWRKAGSRKSLQVSMVVLVMRDALGG